MAHLRRTRVLVLGLHAFAGGYSHVSLRIIATIEHYVCLYCCAGCWPTVHSCFNSWTVKAPHCVCVTPQAAALDFGVGAWKAYFLDLSFCGASATMFCAISGSVPEQPVISTKSGHLFEKALIDKYVKETGKCPITQESLSLEDLLPLKVCTPHMHWPTVPVHTALSVP